MKIILRYGELFLKGKNFRLFENVLVRNLKALGIQDITKLRGRMVIPFFAEHSKLKRIFGIVSYSPVHVVSKDLESIKEAVLPLVKGAFMVKTKRSDKTFPIQSPDMNKLIGEWIEANSQYKFEFASEHVIHIEINQNGVYLFTEVVKCFGGLPTGVEGSVTLLVEDEASILAGLLMMKRGCSLKVTSEKSLGLLQKYSPTKLEVVTNRNGILVSGETFENLKTREGLILKPLISYSDPQIKRELHRFNSSS